MNVRLDWIIVCALVLCVSSSGFGSDPPGPDQKEKISIPSLFDGIPADLRSKVKDNAVRRDRVNDWLGEHVSGKGTTIEVRLPVEVAAERSKDGTYNVRVTVPQEPGGAQVKVLGDKWYTDLRHRTSLFGRFGGYNFAFVGVSPGDAEKLADLKEATVRGKVEEVKLGRYPFMSADSPAILLILQDVQLDGKTLTPDPDKGDNKTKKGKKRGVGLTVGPLFLGSAAPVGFLPISSPRVAAEEPAQPQRINIWIEPVGGNQYFVGFQDPDKNSQLPKLKALLEERLATAREFARLVTARFKNREAPTEEMMEATRVVFEAELDLCGSDKERIAVLEKFLVEAKKNEEVVARFSKAGQVRESSALKGKVERLQVEIALERAKAKAAAKPVEGNAAHDLRDQVALAEAQVAIKRAEVIVAEAQEKRTLAKLAIMKALVAEAQASELFAEKQLKRFEELARLNSIDAGLVEEKRLKWAAVKERRVVAEGSVAEWESEVALEQARVELAQRELAAAELVRKQLKERPRPQQ